MTTSQDALQSYLKQVRTYSTLTFEEEQRLAKLWRDKQDEKAFHSLMESYLRLVVKVALSFRGYGLPVEEMIQEGNIGLMQAIARFDPDKGFRLSTYAMWWIRAQVQEFVLNNWSMVKIGTSGVQKKLFFNLRKIRSQLEDMDGFEHLSPDAVTTIAKELNVKEKDVLDMEHRLRGQEMSLNVSAGGENSQDEGNATDYLDQIVEERPNQEEAYSEIQQSRHRYSLLREALGELNDREREIFVRRRLNDSAEPSTLEVLSQQFKISRERVRQLENRAFEKVQTYMQAVA